MRQEKIVCQLRIFWHLYQQGKEKREKIMEELYVISGITGMTGNELARQLLAAGKYIIGFDNFFASSLETIEDIVGNKRFTFFEADLCDKETMNWLEKKVKAERAKYDRVVYINCAAVVHTEHFYHVDRTFHVNVLGMKDFLDQALAVKAEIYINCSTSEVYSMQSWREGGVRENDYLVLASAEHSQRTSYAAGKLLTEFFMKEAVDSGQIKGCSIRFANVYSRNERYPKHIIPHIITSLLREKKVTLLENAKTCKRTFLHNMDSCRAVLALVSHEKALDGTVYNVATDEEIGIVDLVHICAQQLGINNPIIEFSGYRESDPERRLLSSEKLMRAVGWRPEVSLLEGVGMCVDTYKEIWSRRNGL